MFDAFENFVYSMCYVCTGHYLAIMYLTEVSTSTSTYFKFYDKTSTGALKVLLTLAWFCYV